MVAGAAASIARSKQSCLLLWLHLSDSEWGMVGTHVRGETWDPLDLVGARCALTGLNTRPIARTVVGRTQPSSREARPGKDVAQGCGAAHDHAQKLPGGPRMPQQAIATWSCGSRGVIGRSKLHGSTPFERGVCCRSASLVRKLPLPAISNLSHGNLVHTCTGRSHGKKHEEDGGLNPL